MKSTFPAAVILATAHVLAATSIGAGMAAPIKVSPTNPHWYEYQGQPIVPITSADMYGEIVNKDFNYSTYLDTMCSQGMTYARIYAGAMICPVNEFYNGNPLGPASGKQILPWARSSAAGYAGGGNKFDLDTWDPAYFTRFKDYLQKAADRGIIVEIAFFNGQYDFSWPLCPFNAAANSQGVGYSAMNDVQTLKNPAMFAREVAYVKKLVTEFNSFDNVMWEICDEPTTSGTDANLAKAWARALVDTVYALEGTLGRRHLVTSDEDRPDSIMVNYPRAGFVVGQYYNTEGVGAYCGIAQLLDSYYSCNKPMEINETNYDNGDQYMADAWHFVIGGAAGYNHLSSNFTTANPTGGTAEATCRKALRRLQDFMYSFDFGKMSRDQACIVGPPSGAHVRAISEPGKQYAVEIQHVADTSSGLTWYMSTSSFSENITLKIRAGSYIYEFVDPATGAVSRSGTFSLASDGNQTLATGTYTGYTAVRMRLATDVPPAPKLRDPAFGSTGLPAGPTVKWYPCFTATGYEAQVSTSSDCSNPVIDDAALTGTSKAVGLSSNAAYFWRVRAQNANGWSGWSAIFTFQTGPGATASTAPAIPNRGAGSPRIESTAGRIIVTSAGGDIASVKVFALTGAVVAMTSTQGLRAAGIGRVPAGVYVVSATGRGLAQRRIMLVK